jgi:Zn-dependent protease
MAPIDLIFSLVILIMSVVIHEVAHGYAASMLGDKTAAYEGRLTLNPLKHLDPIGSVLIPLILVLTRAGFIFGWAKPVPYNPYNLKNQRWGEALVAIAGPLTNIVIAIIFGLLIRFGAGPFNLSMPFLQLLSTIVLINITLALFNMVPIPPLDGSKVLFAFLPWGWQKVRYFLDRYGLILALFFALFLWQYLFPVVIYVFTLLTGIR